MGRAWARSKACKYEGALDDIRTALNLDPDDLVMLAHKALNTYLNCEFEDGLVQNTRLIPKRKKPDYFQMGAMHVWWCSVVISTDFCLVVRGCHRELSGGEGREALEGPLPHHPETSVEEELRRAKTLPAQV
jgi:hypothetical protein